MGLEADPTQPGEPSDAAALAAILRGDLESEPLGHTAPGSQNHSATLFLASRPSRKAERMLVVLNCGHTGSLLCTGAQMDLGI